MLNRILKIISISKTIFLGILCILITLHLLSRVVPVIDFHENTDIIKDLIVISCSIFIVSAVFETFILEFILYKNWKNKIQKNIKWLFIVIIWKIVFIILICIMLYLINKPVQVIDQIYYYNDICAISFFLAFTFIFWISSIVFLSLKHFKNIVKIEGNQNEIKK